MNNNTKDKPDINAPVVPNNNLNSTPKNNFEKGIYLFIYLSIPLPSRKICDPIISLASLHNRRLISNLINIGNNPTEGSMDIEAELRKRKQTPIAEELDNIKSPDENNNNNNNNQSTENTKERRKAQKLNHLTLRRYLRITSRNYV